MSEITISTGHPDAGRVYAEALDRVTAERDALQQRLTAADERADQLEGLLREAWEYDIGTPLKRKIMAALKPEEGGGDAVGRASFSDKALRLIDEEIREKGMPR